MKIRLALSACPRTPSFAAPVWRLGRTGPAPWDSVLQDVVHGLHGLDEEAQDALSSEHGQAVPICRSGLSCRTMLNHRLQLLVLTRGAS